jgi:hypothetical protein
MSTPKDLTNSHEDMVTLCVVQIVDPHHQNKTRNRCQAMGNAFEKGETEVGNSWVVRKDRKMT